MNIFRSNHCQHIIKSFFLRKNYDFSFFCDYFYFASILYIIIFCPKRGYSKSETITPFLNYNLHNKPPLFF